MPELEQIEQEIDNSQLDINQLPLGQLQEFTDDYQQNYFQAMELRQKALNIQNTQFNKAIEYITESILLQPMSQLFLITRAIMLYNNFEYKAAIRDISCALERNNNQGSFNAYKYNALCYYELHQYEKSIKNAQLALQQQNDEQLIKIIENSKQKMKQQNEKQKEQVQKQKEQLNQWQKENIQMPSVKNQFEQNLQWFSKLNQTANNLNQQTLDQLQKNEIIQKIVNDDQFAYKLNQIAKDPNALLNYKNDENFIKLFMQVLNQFK